MLELNKIYCMDNIQGMAKLGKETVDLTVTSPPYDDLRKYKGYSFDFERTARGLYWVTKPGGVVVWVVGDATKNGSESGTSFKQALYFKEIGFNLHDTMIYRKINYIPLTHKRYEQEFEYMFVFSKGKPSTFNPIKKKNKLAGEKYTTKRPRDYDGHSIRHNTDRELTYNEYSIKGNIFEYVVGAGNDKTNHPATFPEDLAQDQILSWSNEWDLIFDPFMGSGTTAKMAKFNKRNFVGFDISQEYVDIANKRLEATP